MNGDDLRGFSALLSDGGSVALIAILVVVYRIRDEFTKLFERLISEHDQTRKELVEGQEAIKRAIIAGDPEKARFFDSGGAG